MRFRSVPPAKPAAGPGGAGRLNGPAKSASARRPVEARAQTAASGTAAAFQQSGKPTMVEMELCSSCCPPPSSTTPVVAPANMRQAPPINLRRVRGGAVVGGGAGGRQTRKLFVVHDRFNEHTPVAQRRVLDGKRERAHDKHPRRLHHVLHQDKVVGDAGPPRVLVAPVAARRALGGHHGMHRCPCFSDSQAGRMGRRVWRRSWNLRHHVPSACERGPKLELEAPAAGAQGPACCRPWHRGSHEQPHRTEHRHHVPAHRRKRHGKCRQPADADATARDVPFRKNKVKSKV